MIKRHTKCGKQVKFYQKLKYIVCDNEKEDKIYFCKHCNELINDKDIFETRR